MEGFVDPAVGERTEIPQGVQTIQLWYHHHNFLSTIPTNPPNQPPTNPQPTPKTQEEKVNEV